MSEENIQVGASSSFEVREIFSLALRALARRPWTQLGVGFAFVVTVLVLISSVRAAELMATPSSLPARAAVLGGELFVTALTFALLALHRGFTVAVVTAQLRGGSARSFTAIRSATGRWRGQLGAELTRIATENLPGLLPAFLLLGMPRPYRAARWLGRNFPTAEWTLLALFVIPIATYFVWSTFVRSRLGPTPAVAQAEQAGFVVSLARSRSIATAHRSTYLRLRTVFGLIAVAFCVGCLALTIFAMWDALDPSGASRPSPVSVESLLVGSLVFYAFAYLLFVLDAALDAAFYVRVTESPACDVVAKDFA